jgi:trimethylamine:corrinoid methyltransferase-like protein
VLTAALNGWREFFAAGRTCNDQVFSAIQLVVDLEILQYAQRFLDGYDLGDLSSLDPLIEKIEDARSGRKTFLEQEDLLRQDPSRGFWFPQVFSYERLESWEAGGAIAVVERAREIAKERIRTHEFSREAAVQEDLDRIYRKASSRLLSVA